MPRISYEAHRVSGPGVEIKAAAGLLRLAALIPHPQVHAPEVFHNVLEARPL